MLRRITPVLRGLRRYSSLEFDVPEIHPLLLKRAEVMKTQIKDLEKQIGDGDFDPELNKKFSSLSYIIEHYDNYMKDKENVEGLKHIDDPELIEDAKEELASLLPELTKTSQILQTKLLPPLKHSDNACILELRPGVGGSEASLFTKDLCNMYINFANHMRWRYSIISEQESNSGFLNEMIISIDEPGSFNVLRHESGIHRVQRIPHTETKGRIHTSTSAVVVLPKMSSGDEKSLADDERQFKPGEVRIDTMRAGGKGGQHVNTTDSAVRLVHIPTGIMVMQQDERSQPKNKAKAFSILRARLAALEREKEIAEQKKLRTDQVTTIDRSDKIRTYNYPQNRVTDHRCNFSLHDVEGCMQGQRLNDIIEKVEQSEFEDRLQQLIQGS
ncbi:peptide chain release factor 1, mitochondrial [[Candida] jaroonii]|uniref:Peptide chain release factor 1, mitochondrial n=1 Tax=[Candida] jaroonii TaxID=467808 RepID=A0ACA9YDX8_9ASCO|nr:peptide chain release factor 1, mitochondrial [[Candida] jaroonii]